MNFNAKQFGCFIILLKHSCGNMMISSLGSKGVDGFLSPYCNRVKESIPRTTRNFPFVGSGFILFSTLCNRPHRMTHKTSSPSTSIPVSSADCWPPALPKKFGNASMTNSVQMRLSSFSCDDWRRDLDVVSWAVNCFEKISLSFVFCGLFFSTVWKRSEDRLLARRYTQQTVAHHCFQKEMFQNLRIVICKTYNCAKRTKFSLYYYMKLYKHQCAFATRNQEGRSATRRVSTTWYPSWMTQAIETLTATD